MDYVVKVFTGSGSFCNQSNEFETPDSFQSIFSNKEAMNYLHKNNCWEAWAWHRAEIKYDVKQDRVVFLALHLGFEGQRMQHFLPNLSITYA